MDVPSSDSSPANRTTGVVSNRAAPWTPILTEDDQQRLAPILASITEALATSDLVRFFGPSWSSGAAGVSVFFRNLWEATGDDRWRNHASTLLNNSLERAAVMPVGPSLFAGWAGIAWTISHWQQGLQIGNADPRLAVDDLLLERVGRPGWQGDYDLSFGLVGYGVYALARQDHPNGPALLIHVVDRLAEAAIATKEGMTWRTDAARRRVAAGNQDVEDYFDLGVAHGVPGVIAFLGQACAARIREHLTESLLDQAVTWLLAQRNRSSRSSCFGARVYMTRGHDESSPSRLAWCYGDLGLAVALYSAALNVNRPQWSVAALDIARHAAARPIEQSGVRDAMLCHGAAGNGHLFNRLYQATGEIVFLQAARRWFRRTLDFYRAGAGVGGFEAWSDEAEPTRTLRRNAPGLLLGTAGIGLALLAATSRKEPKWDRPLLVSLAPDRMAQSHAPGC